MRYQRLTMAAAVMAVGAMVTAAGIAAEDSPEQFRAKLNEALPKLMTYDFGGDSGPLNALSALVPASHGKPDLRKELAAKLAGVLGSNAPYGAKDFACRQLSLIGTADSVPALAALLPDEKMSNMARYALERIPDPASAAALRMALDKVGGKLLIGVINSLGNRRDAEAVAGLAKRLGDADVAVVGAAAAALGKIGAPAMPSLTAALASTPAGVRPAVGEACVLCAESLAAQGQRDEAAALCDRVRTADVPQAVRIAALRGAIRARQVAGVPLLIEQLRGTDPAGVALALYLVRELPGEEVTKRVAAELATLPAEKQVRLLQALGDRRCAAALPAITPLAKGGDAQVRIAALKTLGGLGQAAAVPVLLEAAAGEGEVAQAGIAGLASLSSKEADAALLGMVENPDAKVRRVVMEVLGQRRAVAATPALLKAAVGTDAAIRAAAIKSLGNTAGEKDLPALAALVAKPQAPSELPAAEAALAATADRVVNKDVGADAVLAVLPQTDAASRCTALRLLGRIGAAKGVPAVKAAIADANAEVQDTAMRVLSDWAGAEAGGELLDIAQKPANPRNKILALRGYIRLIKQGGAVAEKKLEMCRIAAGLTERDDERKLVLGVLGDVHVAGALAMVVPYLDNPATKAEACVAAVAIAEPLAERHPAEVVAVLQKVVTLTQNADLLKKARAALEKAERKAAAK